MSGRPTERRQGQRIDRRKLLLATGGIVAVPRFSLAAGRMPRIGFFGAGARAENRGLFDAFRGGLAALGWTADAGPAANLAILERWPDEQPEHRIAFTPNPTWAAEFDILVTGGTPATLAARAANPMFPIVFVGVGDPAALGIVADMRRPGGNATGLTISSADLIARRFQLLQQLVPGMRRLAVIIRTDPGLEQRLIDIQAIAGRMGIKVDEFVADTGKALELAFMWQHNQHSDALYLASGPLGPAKRAEILSLARDLRLPAMYCFRVFSAAGGLISFAPDEADLYRRAASYVDKILKGASPANLPVEGPAKFELVINQRTALALGLAVPGALLAQADQVIE